MLKHFMKPLFASFIALLFLSSHLLAAVNPKKTSKDDEHPIQIQSDSADFDNNTGIATHRGNVQVTQGSRLLTSDSLLIHRTSEGKIDKMTAKGEPAYFEAIPDPEKPKITGKAQVIHYFLEGKKLILEQNAELSQNANILQGATVIYYLETGLMTSESSSDQKTTVILKSTGT
jgi:lipopolysaccharide export system protein LptA